MTGGRLPSATKTLVAVVLAVPAGLAIGAAVGATDTGLTDIAVRQVSAGRLADDGPSTTIDDSPSTSIDDGPSTTIGDSPSTNIDDSPSSTSTTIGDSPSTTSTAINDSPSTTSTTTPVADPGEGGGELLVVPAAEVGSVEVRVGPTTLTVVDTTSASGWRAVVEVASGREVEISFRGPGRVDVNVELEDGETKVRIRDRRTGTETETTAGAPSPAPTTETTVPTPTTEAPAPTTTSTTEPAPAATSPPPAAETRSWQLVGGSVSIRFANGGLTLLSAAPNPGFESRVSSSSHEIEVRFEHDEARSRLRVRVDGGRLDVRVEND